MDLFGLLESTLYVEAFENVTVIPSPTDNECVQ
jgi:hypothetical protein